MVKEIVLVIDPALHKIEEILLWRTKWKTAVVFSFAHLVFWLYTISNIRTYCILFSALLLLHLIDGYRQKKKRQLVKSRQQLLENISSLGRYIIYIHQKIGELWVKLKKIKQKNRLQYFLIMLVFWCVMTVIGTRVKGIYLSYMIFWIVFFVPAIIHYDLIKIAIRKALPLLEQLDHSMKYERRSILDKSELLVDVQLPSSEINDDQEEDKYLEEFKLDEEQRRVFERLGSTEDDVDEDSESVEDYLGQNHSHIDSDDEHGDAAFSYNDIDESTNASMLPDDTLPNLSDVLDHTTSGDQVIGRRKTSTRSRPSVLNYYENYFSGGANPKDIDETFEFLDGELNKY